jgi:predicted nucleic acid-binding protein
MEAGAHYSVAAKWTQTEAGDPAAKRFQEVKRWLLDTAILIDHLRGNAACTAWMAREISNGSSLLSLTIVRTEILAGMRPNEAKPTHALFAAIEWRDVTIPFADRAGTLARKYLRSHSGIDTVDFLLAAAALELGATLATRNVKHYPMFGTLRSPY